MAKFWLFCAIVFAGLNFFPDRTRAADPPAPAKPVRVGIIGLDTSHVIAYTTLLNDPAATGDMAGVRVVAGYRGGSNDIPASHDRIEGYTKELKDMGIEIVDSIPAPPDQSGRGDAAKRRWPNAP